MTVINIRGPNGSGKSTLVRALINEEPNYLPTAFYGGHKVVSGIYLPKFDTVVVGPYKPDKATGGMDNVQSSDDASAAVLEAVTKARNTIFEGILISTVFGRWFKVSQEIKAKTGKGMLWFFLEGEKELFIERVKQRRMEGNRDPNKTEGRLIRKIGEKYNTVKMTYYKAVMQSETVVCVPATLPINSLLSRLKEHLE